MEIVKWDAKKYHSEYTREYRKLFPAKCQQFVNNSHLKARHKMTIQEYNELLQGQNNVCAICKRPQTFFQRKFHIDHDHIKGQYRGILCGTCNAGLGMFKDNIEWLRSAQEYLIRWK